MQCPNCSADLQKSERQGIRVDYCRECRGIWLDHDELDKIMARSFGADDDYLYKDREQGRDDVLDRRRQKKRRESFLPDIFDFG